MPAFALRVGTSFRRRQTPNGEGGKEAVTIVPIRVLHRNRHDCAGLQVDRVLGLVCQVRPPNFILVILAWGSNGWVQSSFDPFFGRLRSIGARSSRVGVSIPDACASCVRNSR